MAQAPRIIVIGARPARQGIGEYVARSFGRHGAHVTAIVGTTPATVAQAQDTLRTRYAIDCRGYTDLAEALAREPGEIVAICSPYRLHAAHLAAVATAGRHCLCEKPLCWPPPEHDPIAPFVARGTLLNVLTQWPCTLPAYFELHPGLAGAKVEHFEMRLSPISNGADMVPDAVPHFLSMIRALIGTAVAVDLAAEYRDGDASRLRIDGVFMHPGGATRATLHLETCMQRPRPAWYAVNGARADREIDLQTYQQYFRAGDRRVPFPDPTEVLVGRFLADVASGRRTDQMALDHDQKLLTLFHSAVRAH